MWLDMLKRCVENPGTWQQSYRFEKESTAHQAADHFSTGYFPGEHLFDRAMQGAKGSWRVTFGAAYDGIGFSYYCWIMWLPEGSVPKVLVPPRVYRPHKGHRNLREIGKYDFRTKRPSGDS